MAITVVTIDFWNTLFDSAGGAHRNTARLAAITEAVERSGALCESATIEASYKSIWAYFDHHWLTMQRTPTSDEMVREICRRSGVQLDEESVRHVADTFSRGVLDHPPALLPGAREGLDVLAGRARLALISDTAFSPGSVLRELMETSGIARYFDAYIFSDETGVAKPHPHAFQQALAPFHAQPHDAVHIGDIERTDIRGAKAVGMKAILYKGDNQPHHYAEDSTIADAVLPHWAEIEGVFDRLHQQ